METGMCDLFPLPVSPTGRGLTRSNSFTVTFFLSRLWVERDLEYRQTQGLLFEWWCRIDLKKVEQLYLHLWFFFLNADGSLPYWLVTSLIRAPSFTDHLIKCHKPRQLYWWVSIVDATTPILNELHHGSHVVRA